jgi:RNA polymerase sigma-70 factor, ECF subfamily
MSIPSEVSQLPESESDQKNSLSLQLMAEVARGDHQAFEKLVSLHQNALVGAAYRMLGNLEDAHDLAQLTFLRIWKSAPRYEPTAKFTTWMFTILRNLAANEVRRKTSKPTFSLEASNEDFGETLEDAQVLPADVALEQQEIESAIDVAIATLPEQQRLAVDLRRYQDLPYEEIAEIMQTSVSSVKSLLFRARTTLRQKLAGWLDPA